MTHVGLLGVSWMSLHLCLLTSSHWWCQWARKCVPIPRIWISGISMHGYIDERWLKQSLSNNYHAWRKCSAKKRGNLSQHISAFNYIPLMHARVRKWFMMTQHTPSQHTPVKPFPSPPWCWVLQALGENGLQVLLPNAKRCHGKACLNVIYQGSSGSNGKRVHTAEGILQLINAMIL